MSYLYSLPTTGAIKFTNLVSDPTNAHVSDIARATNARNRVRAVLKETRRAEGQNKDWMACANAIQDYLPHLLAIMKCTENDGLFLKGVPVFAWRSTLSAASNKGKSTRTTMSSFHYELAFVLVTYALALCNAATASVQTLGQYERDLGVSEAERKRGDEQINAAADLLCRAAGIVKFLAENIIPQWEASGSDLKGRPPEVTREVASALSRVCLADAEKLAIRRLLSKSVAVAEAVTIPGPPLPRGHPSPSLLSKLYINVNSHYDSARSLAKSVGSNGSSSGGGMKGQLKQTFRKDKTKLDSDDTGEAISADFRTYLSDGRAFSAALANKWLGVDAGENNNKPGEAIAYLMMARTGLVDLQKRAKTVLPMRKGKAERAKRKDRLVEEMDDIDPFLSAYKRTNDTVLFQPVPAESSLLAQMPAGRSALALKSFSLPAPAFVSRRAIDSLSPDSALANAVTNMAIAKEEDTDSDASEVDRPQEQSNYF